MLLGKKMRDNRHFTVLSCEKEMPREIELKLTSRFISRTSAERRRKNWTCAELARKAGLHPSFVTRLEAGDRRGVTLDTVEALASALGVSPTELLADDDELVRLTGRSPPAYGDANTVTLGELCRLSRGSDVFEGAVIEAYPSSTSFGRSERQKVLRRLLEIIRKAAERAGGIWPALAAMETAEVRECFVFTDLRAMLPWAASAGILYVPGCPRIFKDPTVYAEIKVVVEPRTMLAIVDTLGRGTVPTMVAIVPRGASPEDRARLAYRIAAFLNTVDLELHMPDSRWGSRSHRPPLRQIAAIPVTKTIADFSNVLWRHVDRLANKIVIAMADKKQDNGPMSDSYAYCRHERMQFPYRDDLADAVREAMSAS